MILGQTKLGGGEAGGWIRCGQGREGLDGVELRSSAGRTGETAAQDGNPYLWAPEMLTGGAPGLHADGPVELQYTWRLVGVGCLGFEGFFQEYIHGEGN